MTNHVRASETTSLTFTFDSGWTGLQLPAAILGVERDIFSLVTVRRINNAETRFEGYGLGVGIHAQPAIIHGIETSISLKAFYNEYSTGLHSVSCVRPGNIDCTIFPIFDPDTDDFNGVRLMRSAFTLFESERDAKFWGIALEAPFPDRQIGRATITPKAGIAFNHLSDQLQLEVSSLQEVRFSNTPTLILESHADYYQKLNSSYLGGYLGLAGRHMITPDLVLTFDGEVGIYWVNARYHGTYEAYDLLSTPGWPFAVEKKLTDDEPAVILKARAELQRRFDYFTISGFIEGRYISYAPKILYNAVERSKGIQRSTGQDGTEIGGGRAYGFSAGLRLQFPLN